MSIVLVIYIVLGYWATGKTIYANKIVIYTGHNFFLQRVLWGTLFGWILVPVALLRCILHI